MINEGFVSQKIDMWETKVAEAPASPRSPCSPRSPRSPLTPRTPRSKSPGGSQLFVGSGIRERPQTGGGSGIRERHLGGGSGIRERPGEDKKVEELVGPKFAAVKELQQALEPLLLTQTKDASDSGLVAKELMEQGKSSEPMSKVEKHVETIRVTLAQPSDNQGNTEKVLDEMANQVKQQIPQILGQPLTADTNLQLSTLSLSGVPDSTDSNHVVKRQIELTRENEQTSIQTKDQTFKLQETSAVQRKEIKGRDELRSVSPSRGQLGTETKVETNVTSPRLAHSEGVGVSVKETRTEKETLCQSSPDGQPQITIEKEVTTAVEVRDLTALWKEYVEAETLPKTLSIFYELKGMCEAEPSEGGETSMAESRLVESILPCLKKRVNVIHIDNLWQIYEKKMNSPEYDCPSAKDVRVVCVGAGPGGLRAAIELACLGCRVVVLEKRRKFSRNNLVHIWPNTKKDLLNAGAKIFYPKLCAGGIEHIAIRALQLCMAKIALLLGVKIYPGVRFLSATPPKKRTSSLPTDQTYSAPLNQSQMVSGVALLGERYWSIQVSIKGQQIHQDELLCDVLIGADGEGSVVASYFEFDFRINKFGQAIGITANFENHQTSEELHLDEFAVLAAYKQSYFKGLVDRYGIQLENLVYYRAETHYMVMTVLAQCLHHKGVVKDERPVIEASELSTEHATITTSTSMSTTVVTTSSTNPSSANSTTSTVSGPAFLTRDNIDPEKLKKFVEEVAEYVGLPHRVFAKAATGEPDVSIFDFSKKRQSLAPAKIISSTALASSTISEPVPSTLLVCLVGDALLEPFWPLGTGVNRAFLAGLDATWMIKDFSSLQEQIEKHHETRPLQGGFQQLIDTWTGFYKQMLTVDGSDKLNSNFSSHTIDPSSRYKKTFSFA